MVTLKRDGSNEKTSYVYDRLDEFQDTYSAPSMTPESGKGSVDSLCDAQVLREESPYKTYLKQQLNRSAPAPLLSEEAFYKQQGTLSHASKNVRSRKAKMKGKKRALAFVTLYVLTLVAITSIIIAVNSGMTINASNGEQAPKSTQDSIRPMERQTDVEHDTNWFDKLLDDVSNK